MLQLNYDCQQPVFYLGSASVYLASVTVLLSKLYKTGKITMLNLLLLLVINALIIYVISRLINWLCLHKYNEAAWLVALLPIFGVLFTSV